MDEAPILHRPITAPVRDAFSPLAVSAFRVLWIATLVSNLGTWMHDVGARLLMVELAPAPIWVSLVQTATSLPTLLFALPAGALADLFDRRRVLMATQFWMLACAATLAFLAARGAADASLLLALTFFLAIGAAFAGPAFLSLLPDLVPRSQLAGAIALNGVGVNLARAVGPAIGGALVATAGPAATFALNAVSFALVAGAVFLVRAPAALSPALPVETFGGAVRAGLRFVRFSPVLRAALLRLGLFCFGASGVFALLPLWSIERLGLGARGYGSLIGIFGSGALLGALLLPTLTRRFGPSRLAAFAAVIFAATATTLALTRHPLVAGLSLAVAGGAWLSALSTLQVAVQAVMPAWVRARGLSTHLLVFSGSMSIGSLVFGVIAQEADLLTALASSAAMLVVAAVAAVRWPLEARPQHDLAPSHDWTLPDHSDHLDPRRGPVLVAVEYEIEVEDAQAFREAIHDLGRVRRRDGALQWGIFRDLAEARRWIEVFVVESWGEHLRQHERVTLEDRVVQQRVKAFHRGATPPRITHGLDPREPLH